MLDRAYRTHARVRRGHVPQYYVIERYKANSELQKTLQRVSKTVCYPLSTLYLILVPETTPVPLGEAVVYSPLIANFSLQLS
jgi:hypothetical protein